MEKRVRNCFLQQSRKTKPRTIDDLLAISLLDCHTWPRELTGHLYAPFPEWLLAWSVYAHDPHQSPGGLVFPVNPSAPKKLLKQVLSTGVG